MFSYSFYALYNILTHEGHQFLEWLMLGRIFRNVPIYQGPMSISMSSESQTLNQTKGKTRQDKIIYAYKNIQNVIYMQELLIRLHKHGPMDKMCMCSMNKLYMKDVQKW